MSQDLSDKLSRCSDKEVQELYKKNMSGCDVNPGLIDELFIRLQEEFGGQGPIIFQKLIEILGGSRVTFPDFKYLWRRERDRRIRNEFDGRNYQELAERYDLKTRWVREIIARG